MAFMKKLRTHECSLVNDILVWYTANGRDLPWRRTHLPYHILVSEIMLQQTQVDRVIPKYRYFLRTFSSVKRLADASPAAVITAWKGLGYNRRALFLHQTAKTVRAKHGGRFPQDLEGLKELPGIGEYTARAMCSFAFREPIPLIDTNHRRFYVRLFFRGAHQTDTDVLTAAQRIINFLPEGRVFDWNQAVMDFMAAVIKNDKHELVQHFQKRYPMKEQDKKRKKPVAFEQTDRYVRGRIIDALRERETVHITEVQKRFAHFGERRLHRIVDGLQSDNLIAVQRSTLTLPV
jgi:A/G-specific adenine glycosylase